MDPAHLIQIAAAEKTIGEHLQLLQKSKAELLAAVQETDEIADELRGLLDEARKVHSALSERSERN